jgi:hypothetical protein
LKTQKMNTNRIAIGLCLLGAIGVLHWAATHPADKASPDTAVTTTSAPKKTKTHNPGVVAQLEGHASFNQTAPTKLEVKPEITIHPISQ